jgi:plasmid maintenance system antidote protein VapI
MPESRIGKIVKGERRITADTALRLEMYFGMDASFWPGLQNDYDLLEENRVKEKQPLFIKLHEKMTFGRIIPKQRKNNTLKKVEFKHKHLHKV